MSTRTGIEWTEATWNPVTGCTKVSPGCLNCYIERTPPMRQAGRRFDKKGCIPVELHPERLDAPLRWRKPRMIFVNSMSDLFHEDVPFDFIDKVFAVMALAPRHVFQVLTKRAERMQEYFADLSARAAREEMSEASFLIAFARPDEKEEWEKMGSCYPDWPLHNAWLGFSGEDQKRFNERWAAFKGTPAAVTMVSLEPLLGPIVLPADFLALGSRAWVIAGGESGPGARPSHPDCFRSLRDQCAAARVPFFFKQWGEWAPVGPIYSENDTPEHLAALDICGGSDRRACIIDRDGDCEYPFTQDGEAEYPEFQPPDGSWVLRRTGKRAAGRLLDGVEHNGMPEKAGGK